MSFVNLKNSAPIEVFGAGEGGSGSGDSGLFIVKLVEEIDPFDSAQLKYYLNKNFEEILTALKNGLIPFLVDDTKLNLDSHAFKSYGPLIKAIVNAAPEYEVTFRDPDNGDDVEFHAESPTNPLYMRTGGGIS